MDLLPTILALAMIFAACFAACFAFGFVAGMTHQARISQPKAQPGFGQPSPYSQPVRTTTTWYDERR